MGFEPMISDLASQRSTAELRPLLIHSYSLFKAPVHGEAGEGSRTLDLQLGRLVRYQLRYTREHTNPKQPAFLPGLSKSGCRGYF